MAQGTPGQAPTPRPSPGGEAALTEQGLRQLVETDPSRWDAWYQLGVLALRQGRHAAVIDCLARAVVLQPNQGELHHYLAASYPALGQRDKAVEHYHRVVCLKPELAEAHNNWGIALAQSGLNGQAKNLVRRYARAEKDRRLALAQFSAWLTGGCTATERHHRS